jgi:hypothetical protein
MAAVYIESKTVRYLGTTLFKRINSIVVVAVLVV